MFRATTGKVLIWVIVVRAVFGCVCCSGWLGWVSDEDKFRAQGWPHGMDFSCISEREAASLSGEGLTLPCIGSILAAIMVNPAAPWWPESSTISMRESLQGIATPMGGRARPHKRRNLGGN